MWSRSSRRRHRPTSALVAPALLALAVRGADAQELGALATDPGVARPTARLALVPRPQWLEATAGSEVEEYLRVLSLATTRGAPPPVALRAWSNDMIARIVRDAPPSPWSARFAAPPTGMRPRLVVLRPQARLLGNTTIPFGFNDGAVWAGRGVTSVATAGVLLGVGPLTVRLEPTAFRSENNGFRLADNGRPGEQRFGDPVRFEIDLPQRFGAGPYQRVDWGNSEARLDLVGLAVGLSNVSQVWGPGRTHPLILGANAPGFRHVFVGSGRPINVGIGRVQARLLAGKLEQSAHASTADSLAERLAAGTVVSFAPGGAFRGLEIGGTRFFHRPWRGRGTLLESLRIPIDGLLLKENRLDIDTPGSARFVVENQISSLFARWGFRDFEVYGEFGRDDAALDLRDVLAQPDHDTAYLLGFQRLLRKSASRWTVVRAEVVNARLTHIDRVRGQAIFGTHGSLFQGHTHLGQALGSVATRGGDGATIAVDRYATGGRTSWLFDRVVRLGPDREGAENARRVDVQHSLRYERLRFHRGVDLSAGGGIVYESSRDFRRDVVNVTAQVGVRWGSGARANSP